MKILLPIIILTVTSGLLSAQHHRDCPHKNSPEQKAEVEAMKKIFAGSKDIMIYEGLPHPYEEENLLKVELKRKDTIKLAPLEEPFYTPAVKATNAEALRKTLSSPECIYVHTPHKCGFHADYGLRWQHQGSTYHALFCFGCSDMVVVHGETTQWFSFNKEALKPLLAIYDKKRPKKAKAE